MSLIMSSIIGESSGGSGACIDISTRPNRLNYKEGERLDLTGMVVELYEKGKEPVRIEGYDTIPSDGAVLTKNDDAVIIKYKKDGALFKTILPIDIIYPVGIEVVDYEDLGNTFNLDGIKINVVYNDASKELVSDKTQLVTDPTNGQYIENNRIKIRYKDLPEIVYNTKAINEHGNSALMYQKYLCTFANGTEAEINTMIETSKTGLFRMDDFWKIGDERKGFIDTPNLSNNNNAKQYFSGNETLVVLDFYKYGYVVLYSPKHMLNDNYFTGSNLFADFSTDEYVINRQRIHKFYYAVPLMKNDLYMNNTVHPYVSVYGYGFMYRVIANTNKKYQTVNIPSSEYSYQAQCISEIDTLSDPTQQEYIMRRKIKISKREQNINYNCHSVDMVFGQNCLNYYRVSSNRIKYSSSNRPVNWYVVGPMIADESYTYNISIKTRKASDGNNRWYDPYTTMDISDDTGNIPAPNINLWYVDTNGELQKTNLWNNSMRLAYFPLYYLGTM